MIALFAVMTSLWLNALRAIFGEMIGKLTAVIAAKFAEPSLWLWFEIRSLASGRVFKLCIK